MFDGKLKVLSSQAILGLSVDLFEEEDELMGDDHGGFGVFLEGDDWGVEAIEEDLEVLREGNFRVDDESDIDCLTLNQAIYDFMIF